MGYLMTRIIKFLQMLVYLSFSVNVYATSYQDHTLLSFNEIKALEDNFQIIIKSSTHINLGVENKTFELQTKEGKKYILRISDINNELKNLDEMLLLKMLNNIYGVKGKIPVVVLNKNKERITKINNRIFCLFEYIPGVHKDNFNMNEIYQIGLSTLFRTNSHAHFWLAS